jgi:hypothetical protein
MTTEILGMTKKHSRSDIRLKPMNEFFGKESFFAINQQTLRNINLSSFSLILLNDSGELERAIDR